MRDNASDFSMNKFKFNKKPMLIIGVVAVILVMLVAIIIHTFKPGKEALGEFMFAESESGDLYDEFLAGKGTISYSNYRKHVTESTYAWNDDGLNELIPEQDVSLEELVEAINNGFASTDLEYMRGYKVESVSYSFIDCGMDGKRELVLSFACGDLRYYDFKLVIKDIDNRLQVVFACFTHGDSDGEVYLNEYGGIRFSIVPGNGNWHTYHDSYGFVDGTGELKGIYDIASIERHVLDEDMPILEDIDKKYDITEYTLMYDTNEFHTFAFHNREKDIDEDPDIPDLKESLDKCFECESISLDEFNKMKKERLNAVGASEEVIVDVRCEELEYTQIYKGKGFVEETEQEAQMASVDVTDTEEELLGDFMFATNESGDLYDEFLAGKGTISFSNYRRDTNETTYSWNDGGLIDLLPKQDVTLEQLVKEVNDAFAPSDADHERNIKVESVSYSFIDCGMDGDRELVLSIDCTTPPFYDSKMVIKDIDSRLQVVFACYCQGERWDVDLNEYGGVRNSGVPGNAACMYYDVYAFIDSTGEIKPIYDIEAVRRDGLGEAMPSLQELDEKYVVTEYTLSYDTHKYHTFGFYNPDKNIDEDPDIPNLKESIDKCFATKSLSKDEFDKMKKKRLEEVGVSEEVVDDEEFEKLEYTQIYYERL